MNRIPLTLVREEWLSQHFAAPDGRLVTAELTVIPTAFTGRGNSDEDTLQVVVEVRADRNSDFRQVAESAILPQSEENTARVTIPTREEPAPADQPPAVFRLRLIHIGTMQPRYELQIKGL